MNSITEREQIEYKFLKNKINLEECKNLGELIEKKYLIELLGIENSLKELRNLKRKSEKYNKSVSECIREQKDKNRIEKKLLCQILNKSEELLINELRKEYQIKLMDLQRQDIIKEKQDKRQIMLRELKIEKTSMISDAELEDSYENKKKLVARIHKQGEEFMSEHNKKYEKKVENFKIYDCDDVDYGDVITYEDVTDYDDGCYIDGNEINTMLYNPGGATIYTKSNAMGEMIFNVELGIYEQN